MALHLLNELRATDSSMSRMQWKCSPSAVWWFDLWMSHFHLQFKSCSLAYIFFYYCIFFYYYSLPLMYTLSTVLYWCVLWYFLFGICSLSIFFFPFLFSFFSSDVTDARESVQFWSGSVTIFDHFILPLYFCPCYMDFNLFWPYNPHLSLTHEYISVYFVWERCAILDRKKYNKDGFYQDWCFFYQKSSE